MAAFYTISTLTDDPAGIKVIENPTKTLKAVLFPRDYLPEFSKMTEASQAGVYILYNTIDKHERPHIYIGQTGYSVTSRLSNHNRNKDFWDQALVFVEKGNFLNLNSAHAKIIESILIDEAARCGVVVMDNSAGSNAPKVQKADQLASATWAGEVITITKILGLAFFVPHISEDQPDNRQAPSDDTDISKGKWTMIPDGLYTMTRKIKSMKKTCNGIMEVRNGNCILKAGSEISPTIKNLSKGWEKKWNTAHKSGDVLAEDIPMNSPSGCAALIVGGTCNDWVTWKNSRGEYIDIYRI